MRRYETIKSKREFDNIIHNAKFQKNKFYIIYYQPSTKLYNRYGIAISTKMGHAVVRNKYKRQIRDIIYKSKNMFPKTQDYIIMIKRSCLDLQYSEMLIEFQKLIEEIK